MLNLRICKLHMKSGKNGREYVHCVAAEKEHTYTLYARLAWLYDKCEIQFVANC